VEQIVSQIVSFLQQGIAAIFKFIQLIWTWSFGQILAILHSDWQSLPIWKIVVLAAVVIAIVYVLYKAIIQLWKAAEEIFKAFIGLLSVLVTILPFILIAGLIAAAGGWVIQNVNF
jgi:type VI protein secretion system component VasF